MDLFRKALLQAGPPQDFALQTVQQAIKPQVRISPTKEKALKLVKLVQDENQLLENILRALLQELVSAAVQSGEGIMQYGQSIADKETLPGQIPRLLEIVLYLCEREHIEGGMIFQLLEDLTEMSTMRNCKDIFGYIESKQDILGKPELFARGKLVMLRTCNQLLRRLSKANDVVFCGRVIMFLAHFFPLSERSAVNIKGVFNTSNQTKYEKDTPECSTIDFNFYKTFWSLQEFFSNPALLAPAPAPAPAKWTKFTSSLAVVLNTFEAQPLSDEEGSAINLEDEGSNFSIKYLTSSNLMGLELKDPSFRRHVLVQCLILFNYLKDEIISYEERVKNILETTPPEGKEFLHSIEHILEREKNWVWWKRDGCPPFEKQPIEKKLAQEGGRKRRLKSELFKGGYHVLKMMSADIVDYCCAVSYLIGEVVDLGGDWEVRNYLSCGNGQTRTQCNALTDPQRVRIPAIMDYWKPLAEDMDESAGIEEEYHHKNNRVYCWKGLRFSARQDLEGFSRFTEHGIEGVVPLELLPSDLRSKYQSKLADRSKRAKKDEAKGSMQQHEESQIAMGGSETDVDGSRREGPNPIEGNADAMIASSSSPSGNTSQRDGDQKHSSDDVGLEMGQIEGDEQGIIDGETDDLDAVA
ncbi:THO complex subunit 1 [Striga asiatica]|uniref:THO complex subunit 1 n=1 Tax=Striga asiatica TaxID=4170 RepID=A0A5A7QDD2_STRAF|nr:THO complex subunit 1 [Striga asiatica]